MSESVEREDGCPLVCLNCDVRPTEAGPGNYFCSECFTHAEASVFIAARNRWTQRDAPATVDLAGALAASQADVSRLTAEVDRLRAERDEQVRVNGFLVGTAQAFLAESPQTERVEPEHGETWEAWEMCLHCDCAVQDCEAGGKCWGVRVRTFLASRALSTPTGTRAGAAAAEPRFHIWVQAATGASRWECNNGCDTVCNGQGEPYSGPDNVWGGGICPAPVKHGAATPAAAAENQKAETPGSGTPPTEEGPTT